MLKLSELNSNLLIMFDKCVYCVFSVFFFLCLCFSHLFCIISNYSRKSSSLMKTQTWSMVYYWLIHTSSNMKIKFGKFVLDVISYFLKCKIRNLFVNFSLNNRLIMQCDLQRQRCRYRQRY